MGWVGRAWWSGHVVHAIRSRTDMATRADRPKDPTELEAWTHRGGWGRLAAYAGVGVSTFAVAICATSLATYPKFTANPGGENALPSKAAYYLQHRGEYNVVFLGDSRTYCGIHPALIDDAAGTRSYNLAVFANWVATQYALAGDIAAEIPKDTTVVMSVGYANIRSDSENLTVQRIYPIGFGDALRLQLWGFRSPGVWDNVFYFSPFAHAIADRAELRSKFTLALRKHAQMLSLISPARAADANKNS
jgi:hypothetical protein